VSYSRTIWDEGRENGRAVVALGAAVALSAIAVNLAMVGRVSMFFDLWFVLICLGLALLVHPRDFFTVGVLAAGRPEAIASPRDGIVQAVVSGLAHHSVALIAGYALCLVTLLVRQRLATPVRQP
jgi:hypothetical protein